MPINKKNKRLSQVARELNVGLAHLAEFLNKKGHEVESRPNAKINMECYDILLKQFSSDKNVKKESEKLSRKKIEEKEEAEVVEIQETIEEVVKELPKKTVKKEENFISNKKELKIVGKIDLDSKKTEKQEKTEEKTVAELVVETEKIEETTKVEENKIEELIETKAEKVEEVPIKEVVEETIKEKVVQKTEKEKPVAKIEEKAEISEEKESKAKTSESDEKSSNLKIVDKIDLKSLNTKVRPERKKTRVERRKERRNRELASKNALDKAKENRLKEQAELEKKQKQLEADKIQAEKEANKKKEEENFIGVNVKKLTGPTVIGKIELKEEKSPKKHSSKEKRKRRKRIRKPVTANANANKDKKKTTTTTSKTADNKSKYKKQSRYKKKPKAEVNSEDVKNQVRETLAKLTDKKRKSAVKHRRRKRDDVRQKVEDQIQKTEQEKSILRITEFISANELAKVMDISVNDVIKTCFNLGEMVAINQRLDAEIIAIVAEEFNFEVEFISVSEHDDIEEIIDDEKDLLPRPPIVTIMGHVDHGKTSLLDFIRKTNVIAGEAGGITQHIGAYNVDLETGERITFLDTPGHEAFTAMRARGAKVTDLAVIMVAADDDIMPQTEEAIAHAQAAGVPIIFAINKIDKEGANPERVKRALADRNLLIEEWGGKIQSADISAKFGKNVDKLLEEIVLAAEMLELKANPNRTAKGTVIEASLDKGRGYVSTILVQTGTLKVGDIILAGSHSGKVKAMFNERNKRVKEAGPSEPVLVLGLDGAPLAGDRFDVMENEKTARDIAAKYKRLQREQTLRAHRHITLDEIGRRLKIGNFQELNVIIKGDVIGSVEAVADSLIKLSTEEIQVKVIHKAVGQISETDVMLAAASDAVIIGFQVRPVLAAKKLAEKEEIEIRLYSVIYDAINDLKDAMTGMLSPEIREEVTATLEVRNVFKITKVGKVAGCFVLDGKIYNNSKVRLIRDGIVVYTGELDALKRHKDEVKDVVSGMECGLSIKNYQDIKVGDIVEAYTETEIARKL